MAREYYSDCFSTATYFFDSANDAIKRGKTKLAAFLMHQATERYYHCALLVCTFYSPHIHNLDFLRTQAEKIDRRLIDVWPREVKADRSRLEKLKEAYIKARYSKHYPIGRAQV